VLRPLQNRFDPRHYPNLLVGLGDGDDAAVYRISEDVAVIQTVDFFTPIVDDPYDYGAIAAANALSDVYAMGGEAVLAMNVCGFPDNLPQGIIAEILRGGADKVAEAGAVLVGGHTVRDNEPKYGLAVMGTVHPQRVLTKAGARPGDRLILTKPLGVGVITTALKRSIAQPAHVTQAVSSMEKLNRTAAQLIQEVGVHACTDITGFALLGHGMEMAQKSGVRLHIYVERLPFLEGAIAYAEQQVFPGGTCSNQRMYEASVDFAPQISEAMRMLLFTPETSGGLLVALPAERLPQLAERFQAAGEPYWVIGEVVAGEGIQVLP
jgi:selenide,water dikinase